MHGAWYGARVVGWRPKCALAYALARGRRFVVVSLLRRGCV